MTKPHLALAITLLALLPAQHLSAHGGATGIVKERMDLMVDMKDEVKKVSAIFKGQRDYDADLIRRAASLIEQHSGEAMTRLFPQGSLDKHTEAKPAVWEEWQRFKELANKQTELAQQLHAAADNQAQDTETADSASMMGSSAMMGTAPAEPGNLSAAQAFKALADNCAACHKHFRLEKK